MKRNLKDISIILIIIGMIPFLIPFCVIPIYSIADTRFSFQEYKDIINIFPSWLYALATMIISIGIAILFSNHFSREKVKKEENTEVNLEIGERYKYELECKNQKAIIRCLNNHFEILQKEEIKSGWITLLSVQYPDIYRELFLREGNLLLKEISADEAKQIIEEWKSEEK